MGAHPTQDFSWLAANHPHDAVACSRRGGARSSREAPRCPRPGVDGLLDGGTVDDGVDDGVDDMSAFDRDEDRAASAVEPLIAAMHSDATSLLQDLEGAAQALQKGGHLPNESLADSIAALRSSFRALFVTRCQEQRRGYDKSSRPGRRMPKRCVRKPAVAPRGRLRNRVPV